MAVPEQLPQIAILRTRYPDPWKSIFQHQLQQELSIFAVSLLFPYPPGLNLCRVSNPQFETQFRQQPLEPACMPRGLHPHSHVGSPPFQIAVKLLRFSFAVVQLLFAAFPSFFVYKRDLLKARVIIYSYNDHIRLLPPEPWLIGTPKSTHVEGADIVMKSDSGAHNVGHRMVVSSRQSIYFGT